MNSKQNIIAKTSMNTKTDKNREAFKNTIVSFISSGVMGVSQRLYMMKSGVNCRCQVWRAC